VVSLVVHFSGARVWERGKMGMVSKGRRSREGLYPSFKGT
jgi:hypothetical protein